MKIISKGKDWTGWHWWIKLWKPGIAINFYNNINLVFGIDFTYKEEGKWISLYLGPLNITYFFHPDWD